MRVCVIGAGYAGLAAADALERAGIEVAVFEARDRVGGRVWSRVLGNGAVVEFGAEFVLHDYETMREFAERLGLVLAPTGMAYGDREPRNCETVSKPELLAGFATLSQEASRTTGSVGELLDRMAATPAVREVIVGRLSISAAHDARELAGHLLAHTSSTFSTEESHRVGGGNQRLAEALASGLHHAVHLSHPIRRIRHSDSDVTVSGEASAATYDAAIVTVPASVIDGIAFDPPPSDARRAALAGVDYGHAAKLFVPLRKAAVPSAVMSVADRYWSWTARGGDGSVQPVISCFAGSSQALARLEVTSGPSRWCELLRALRPDLALDCGEAMISNWDDDPWVRAAYGVELAARPRDTAALIEPMGRVYFAGEHTAGAWAGTMEGALRSGLRAAHQVISHI